MMKRISTLFIIICVGITTALADGIQYFEHVKRLYGQGRYEEAIQGFTACQNLYSDELDVVSLNSWIVKCKTKIREKKIAVEAKKQAEIAEAQRKAEEVKQQERIEKKLLYVSSNAFIFNKEYTGMPQAIKGYIADNSEQRLTDDPEMAYWGVYISANAYDWRETKNKMGEPTYYSNVIAYVKIVNEVTQEIIYEGEIEDSSSDFKDYEGAARNVYKKKINIRIVNEILTYLNK